MDGTHLDHILFRKTGTSKVDFIRDILEHFRTKPEKQLALLFGVFGNV